MSNLDLTQDELVEAKTHINLIQKSYRKLESAQYAVRELEGDFRDLITLHIQQKGGDPELQYNLNLYNKISWKKAVKMEICLQKNLLIQAVTFSLEKMKLKKYSYINNHESVK